MVDMHKDVWFLHFLAKIDLDRSVEDPAILKDQDEVDKRVDSQLCLSVQRACLKIEKRDNILRYKERNRLSSSVAYDSFLPISAEWPHLDACNNTCEIDYFESIRF